MWLIASCIRSGHDEDLEPLQSHLHARAGDTEIRGEVASDERGSARKGIIVLTNYSCGGSGQVSFLEVRRFCVVSLNRMLTFRVLTLGTGLNYVFDFVML